MLQLLILPIVFTIISTSVRPPPPCRVSGPPPLPGTSQTYSNTCPPPRPPPKGLDKNVTEVIQIIIVNKTINETILKIINENWEELTFKYNTCIRCIKLFPKEQFYDYIYQWLESQKTKIVTFNDFFKLFLEYIKSGSNKSNLRLLSPPSPQSDTPPPVPPKELLLEKLDEVSFCFLPSLTYEDVYIQYKITMITDDKFNTLRHLWGNQSWHTQVCQCRELFNNHINTFDQKDLNYLDSKCEDD